MRVRSRKLRRCRPVRPPRGPVGRWRRPRPARPGPDDWFWVVFAAIGLLLAGWLARRRSQLLAVAADPEVLITALTGLVTGRELWSQLIDNLSAGRVGAVVARRSRPLRVLSGLWRGVRAAGVLAEFAASDELAP